MISLSITGLTNVQNMFKQLGKKELYTGTVHEVGKKAKGYADYYCPVDKGDLKGSIFLELNDNGFQLGALAGHAVFNEYGSMTTPIGSVSSPKAAKFSGFRPFLRPSIYKATREAGDIFGKKVANIVSHGGKA